MRFHRLQIPAFGPFTNLDLAFPRRERDLHVFYGKNEAGKSSLLRAIRDLLFGIHGQSTDNFLHDYKNLRVAAEITNRAGETLSFQRRKGNKNTLLDDSGNALPDHALQPFLGNVDESFFSTMFGMGGTELRDGARQLLQGDGDIGKALFSASLGGTPVQRVLDSLEEEASRLFKGRATTNVSIRPTAKRYHELLKQCKDALVGPEVWEQLTRNLEAELSQESRLKDEIAECETTIAWLSRCEDAQPIVARFAEELRQLHDLPELPTVASDFVERAKQARSNLAEAVRQVTSLTAQIERDEGRLGDCQTAPEVLAIEDELDYLHQELGVYRTRKESLAILQSKLAGIEPSLRGGMMSLEIKGDFEELEGLRLGSAARLEIETAAGTLRDAQSRHEDSLRQEKDLTATIERLGKELESLPEADLEPLRLALEESGAATDAHKTLENSRTTVAGLSVRVKKAHALVLGAPEDCDEAARLPVPAKSTIRQFRERFAEIDRDLKSAAEKVRNEQANITKLEADLKRLERRGQLPTDSDLRDAREHRERGWKLVLKDWKGGGTDERFDPELPLEEAFPRSIQAADQIADQLRTDADAVAQAEEKRLQIQASRDAIDQAEAEISRLEAAKAQTLQDWSVEWKPAGIQPRSPDEMEEWRENWLQFQEMLGKLRDEESSLRSKSERIQVAVDSLKAALGITGDKSFTALQATARKTLQQGDESGGKRKNVIGQIAQSKVDLERAEQTKAGTDAEIKDALATWKTRCQSVGLPADTTPDTGLALLRERADLITKFDQWKEFSAETRILSEQIAGYEVKVNECALALGVSAESIEAKEAALSRKLTEARKAQTEYDQIAGQIKEAKVDLESARQEETSASQSLQELMALAKVGSAEDLEPLLGNLETKLAIEEKIEGTRDALQALARGQSVDEFVQLVRAESTDDLSLRKSRMESDLAEKKNELRGVQANLVELNRRHTELSSAADTAADLRQQAESELATLRRDASQFIRLRLAAHLLERQIERFREKNQAPLLEKSGQVFRHITQGAYEGLSADFNEQDLPVLVGNRAGGGTVPVEGMSDGTRDQLYLALRLAALDHHLEEHEPMPLILDDVLITFDNDRTKAILPQLADLSQRTQVFLFTHHEHLVELCRETLGEDSFQLHALTART